MNKALLDLLHTYVCAEDVQILKLYAGCLWSGPIYCYQGSTAVEPHLFHGLEKKCTSASLDYSMK